VGQDAGLLDGLSARFGDLCEMSAPPETSELRARYREGRGTCSECAIEVIGTTAGGSLHTRRSAGASGVSGKVATPGGIVNVARAGGGCTITESTRVKGDRPPQLPTPSI